MGDEEGEDDGGLKRETGGRGIEGRKKIERGREDRRRECIREDDGKVMGNYWIEIDGRGR